MEIIRGIRNVRPEHRGCVATIGNFDGVHHGHQLLLAHLNAKRDELNAPSVLITFEPLPREYFSADNKPGRLTRFREKVTLLRRTGLDRMICLPFNEQVSQITATSVIEDFLVGQLGVRYVVVGDDFRFGRGREGDYAMLKRGGDKFGFEVSHIGTLTFDHERVSSTRIRRLVAEGRVDEAGALLGHHFFIDGTVVRGAGRGRELGVPTANLRTTNELTPPHGVYATALTIDGVVHPSVTNIGVRPTFDDVPATVIEVHALDVDRDLYGQILRLDFIQRLRDERRFPDVDALKGQIDADVRRARRLFDRLSV